MSINVGSVCSGIEAASVAWSTLDFNFKWFSEIGPFPSALLKEKYPHIPNLGDMNDIPKLLASGSIDAPDMICGGTPCQAFSSLGLRKGLEDERGNLTISFVKLVEQNDKIRVAQGKKESLVLWENVEGVLSDKTNAFGSLISSLAGLEDFVFLEKWPLSGVLKGPTRNVAWRTLDAKFFGIPQQRKRVYLLASGKDFDPETVLFEDYLSPLHEHLQAPLSFEKEGHTFEVFRAYTDCLYSAYGQKWNGNAAAHNGSLFIIQNGRVRRLSPLECERLMGFPDNYTNARFANRTARYKALGNSWAVPVIRWIGERILNPNIRSEPIPNSELSQDTKLGLFGNQVVTLKSGRLLNATRTPSNVVHGDMSKIVTAQHVADKIYISPKGAQGILRRAEKRKASMNVRLKEVLDDTAHSEG